MNTTRFQLMPTNSRFKRLIHDHGKDWVVIGGPVSMPCFGGELGVTAKASDDPDKVSNFRVKDCSF
jgi:hypothetical protein